jgi:hypothetical protein
MHMRTLAQCALGILVVAAAVVSAEAQEAGSGLLIFRPFTDFTLIQATTPIIGPMSDSNSEAVEVLPVLPLLRGHERIAFPQSNLSGTLGYFKVKGGTLAKAADYPALFWYVSAEGAKCSASQVGPRVVITAAHCLVTNSNHAYEIDIGIELKGEATLRPGKCTISPRFKAETDRAPDWALCVLEDVRPVARYEVISLEPVPAGSIARLAGYGCVSPTNKNVINDLYVGDVTIELPHPTSSPIVIRASRKDVGLCPGDSGGPTFVTAPVGRRQIAVNSHTIAEKSILVGFANDEFRSFIEGWMQTNNVAVCGSHAAGAACEK